MTRRYTTQEKQAALRTLDSCGGDFNQAAAQTGIPARTLRKWQAQWREQRAGRLLGKIERLHEQLVDDAGQIAQAVEQAIEGAPLNQLASALGVVIDRTLKVHEHLGELRKSEGEEVTRIEYYYDGEVHEAPPWADPDFEGVGPVHGGGLRETLRENGNREVYYPRESDQWGKMLVAGADLPDGEPGLAGFEDRFGEGYPAAD